MAMFSYESERAKVGHCLVPQARNRVCPGGPKAPQSVATKHAE